MTPAELSANFFAAVLFYCAANSDTTLYSIDLSNVGSYAYNSGLGYDEMTSWAPTGYSIPDSTTDLLPYGLNDVLAYFNTHYIFPSTIKQLNAQCLYPLTTSELDSAVIDSSFTGLLALDTTVQKIKRCTGSSWVALW